MIACTASCPSSLSRPASALRISSVTRALDVGDQRRSGDQALRPPHREGCLGGDGLAELQQPCLELIGGTTSDTSPRRKASSASTNRDSSRKRRAGSWPTRVGRDQVSPPSGDVPARRYPGCSRAVSAAMRMSAAIASERPAPTATPLIPATTGLSVSNRSAERKAADPALVVEQLRLVGQPRLDGRVVAATQVEARAEPVAVAGQRHHPDVVVGSASPIARTMLHPVTR